MSIASEITRINNNIAAAYTAASGKGATLPATEDSANLATCIGSIPAGGNTRAFPANYWVDTSGNVHNIGNDVNNTALPNASGTGYLNVLSANTTQISGYNEYLRAYQNNTDIVKIDLSAVTTISGIFALREAFDSSAVIAADVSSLSEISGGFAFANAFKDCAITELSFPSLSSVTATNCMDSMLSGVDGCDLHFPSNMGPTIGNLTGFPSFGGTNINVYFDLPAVS